MKIKFTATVTFPVFVSSCGEFKTDGEVKDLPIGDAVSLINDYPSNFSRYNAPEAADDDMTVNMAYLFEDGSGNATGSKTIAITGTSVTGREIILEKPLIGGYLYFDMPNTPDTIEVDIAWHNGSGFMKWHAVKDAELNVSWNATTVAQKIEIPFKLQDSWITPVYGYKVRIRCTTGGGASQEFTFTNGVAVEEYDE